MRRTIGKEPLPRNVTCDLVIDSIGTSLDTVVVGVALSVSCIGSGSVGFLVGIWWGLITSSGPTFPQGSDFYGAAGKDRTYDLSLTKGVLYH